MNSENDVNAAQPAQNEQPWAGYGVDELRYRRALALVRLEAQKATIVERFKPKKKPQAERTFGMMSGLFQRIQSKLTFVDYVLLGYNLSKLLLRLKKRK